MNWLSFGRVLAALVFRPAVVDRLLTITETAVSRANWPQTTKLLEAIEANAQGVRRLSARVDIIERQVGELTQAIDSRSSGAGGHVRDEDV